MDYGFSIFIRFSNAHFRSLSVSDYGSRTNDGQNPEMQREQGECFFARTIPPNRAPPCKSTWGFLESQDKLGVLLTYQGHRVFQSLAT